MLKYRSQKFEDLPRGCGNIEYFGLSKGQKVTVRGKGRGTVTGEPPQGSGIYVNLNSGEQVWVGGEEIVEATRPK